jgi:hypothetical protein
MIQSSQLLSANAAHYFAGTTLAAIGLQSAPIQARFFPRLNCFQALIPPDCRVVAMISMLRPRHFYRTN